MIQTNEVMYIVTREEMDGIIKRAASAAARKAVKKINPGNDDELWDAEKTGNYLSLSA